MRRVLYVCHNHPSNRPGGAEIYAHELYRAVRDDGRFEAFLLAKSGPPFSDDIRHNGTRLGMAGNDPNEYFVHTTGREFDRLFGTMPRKDLYEREWRTFLELVAPDVIHFQHTLYLGYDMIRAARRTLPSAAIVYTLHEFLPICHHSGQMVRRTGSRELCTASSPRRCHECFPRHSPQTFFMRERFIKSAFELVDMFITPSEHARQRYIEWGLPPGKVMHEDYGRIPVPVLPDPPDAGRRGRLGFIGQATPFKGVEVLLEAMKILGREELDVELMFHGGNLEHQPADLRSRVEPLLAETEANVTFRGNYAQEELPGLLSAVDWVVVPSTWWETGPLVIHEALMHRRPVICSDIGSMLERIDDRVNGLHFHVGDPDSLADTIRYAVTTPGLWDEIRGRITDPHPMKDHLAVMYSLYHRLVRTRSEMVR